MSGGHFDYNQHKIKEISEDIQEIIKNNGKKIPEEHLCMSPDWYIKYPEDKYYPNYNKNIINEFKNAIKVIEKAYVYAQRIDWYLSGDDGEDSFHERLDDDLKRLEEINNISAL